MADYLHGCWTMSQLYHHISPYITIYHHISPFCRFFPVFQRSLSQWLSPNMGVSLTWDPPKMGRGKVGSKLEQAGGGAASWGPNWAPTGGWFEGQLASVMVRNVRNKTTTYQVHPNWAAHPKIMKLGCDEEKIPEKLSESWPNLPLMVVFWGIIVTICKCGIHHELDVNMLQFK